jgi:hypothetical protein
VNSLITPLSRTITASDDEETYSLVGFQVEQLAEGEELASSASRSPNSIYQLLMIFIILVVLKNVNQ